MNPKTLFLLEYPKILARLKAHAGFSASETLADRLRPTSNFEKAKHMLQITSEARRLLTLNDSVSFQGAADLRPLVDQALHGVTLDAADLLAVRNTLVISRTARRILENVLEEVPLLGALAEGLSDGLGLVDVINKTISERGEVLDSASEELSRIRSEMKVTHARLMERMMRYLNDPNSAHMLQELLITQRSGRYVLPLRAEFKGRIKAIIHDQSSSGATLFIEPLAVVEWNNRYRELELAERDEVLKVLHALSLRIAEQAEVLNQTIETMAELDLALMKARFADDLHAAEPELVPFTPDPPDHHPGSTIYLLGARHPLLDPQSVVPIDVQLDDQTFSVVLTGPNTGGKTVTLKTVGLMVLMAQSGMHIPAISGSRLSLFRDVFADIGDEQSIEQSLSTFSGHITQLVRILKRADYRCLVLLDELGAGTDPQEGSALARAVLSHLLQRRITNLVATHYPELKVFAHATQGVVNASLEFDLETLKPTYHLMIGLPGRSNALAIAERLGLREDIIAAARMELDPTDLRAEDLLDEIHRQRDLARENFAQSDRMRREAETQQRKLAEQLENLERNKEKILTEAQNQADAELEALRSELTEMRREMARMRKPAETLDTLDTVEDKLVELEEVQEKKEIVKKARRPRQKKPVGPIKVGDKVLVRKLGAVGVVTAIDSGDVEVQVGMLRVRLKPEALDRKQTEEAEEIPPQEMKTGQGKTSLPMVASPGLELDLRGRRVEEALESLDGYLERAYLAGLPFVRIIHGHGTGALRQVVRDTIKTSSHVQRWEAGGEKEGGDGVSVVFFVSH